MNVAELFGSDFTLIGAALAGLAITSLAILRDLKVLSAVPAEPLPEPV